jgi:hypothetical protein
VGYFEGIDSERGFAWRASDSIGLRQFLGYGLTDSMPDHSTISRNRRRIRGRRGQALRRKRGEFVERSFAHCYDTGGMRRTHLKGHENILKRLLIHAAGFNLGLMLRRLLGVGTARGLQDLAARLRACFSRCRRTLSRATAQLHPDMKYPRPQHRVRLRAA